MREWLIRAGCFAAGAAVWAVLAGLTVTLEVGSLAEWVGGLGTIGALIFAGRQLAADVEVRRASDEEAAERMAKLVHVTDRTGSGSEHDTAINGPRPYIHVDVVIHNDSPRRIRDLAYRAEMGGHTHYTDQKKQLGAGVQTAIRTKVVWDLATVLSEEPLLSVLEWTDNGGRRWRFTRDGGLERIG